MLWYRSRSPPPYSGDGRELRVARECLIKLPVRPEPVEGRRRWLIDVDDGPWFDWFTTNGLEQGR